MGTETYRALSFLSLFFFFFTPVLFCHPQICQHLICTSKRAESGAWQLKLTKESLGYVEEQRG